MSIRAITLPLLSSWSASAGTLHDYFGAGGISLNFDAGDLWGCCLNNV
jgi:hypothetical protein